MKVWKKGLVVVGATILAASVSLYTVAASNVTVIGKIWPKAGISMNFNQVEFNGTVGDSVPATTAYKNNGAAVTSPQFIVRYKNNYTVNVKSEALTGTDTGKNPITLDTSRISVKSGDNTVNLTTSPQSLVSENASVPGKTLNTAKAVDIKLDLTEGTYNDQIELLTTDADIKTTITFLFSGL